MGKRFDAMPADYISPDIGPEGLAFVEGRQLLPVLTDEQTECNRVLSRTPVYRSFLPWEPQDKWGRWHPLVRRRFRD